MTKDIEPTQQWPDFSILIGLASIPFCRALLPVCLQPQRMNQGCRQLVRLKSKRPRSALIGNAAFGVDQVDAIRPAGICHFDMVVEAIDEGWEFDAQPANTRSGYGGAFLLVARAAKEDVVPNVALHLPHVGRMGFKDVDRVEIDLALVLLRKLI